MAPIHDAARDADVEKLRRLLEEGVSPDMMEEEHGEGYGEGGTPLNLLCFNQFGFNNSARPDRVACTKLLIEAGANLDATNHNASTALQYAALNGDATIMSLLVKAGANVDAADDHGWTALHQAATTTVDCVEVLLAAGAGLDARASAGWRPFDLALKHRSRRMWPLFLRAGAEIPPTDNTDPYIVRVKNAGGWKKYEQAHLARITSILAPTPLLPPELVRKVLEFWLHAGYY